MLCLLAVLDPRKKAHLFVTAKYRKQSCLICFKFHGLTLLLFGCWQTLRFVWFSASVQAHKYVGMLLGIKSVCSGKLLAGFFPWVEGLLLLRDNEKVVAILGPWWCRFWIVQDNITLQKLFLATCRFVRKEIIEKEILHVRFNWFWQNCLLFGDRVLLLLFGAVFLLDGCF